ncbi:MAG: ribosome maturation factor RimM [Bacteroidetes bacterium]|nr:ribosome maturation factor RimM [Bacteroidota bacterium]
MTHDDCYYLGYIVKPHGLKGAFQVSLDVSFPEEYSKMESVFIELDGQLVPFFISSVAVQANGKARIEIEDIATTDDARKLVGKKLFLPLTVLPKLTGNHFYHHEIQGYLLIDENDIEVGLIKEIQDSPAQDLIVVHRNGKEVLVPILENTILKLDREGKTLKVNLLPGLLEIFS